MNNITESTLKEALSKVVEPDLKKDIISLNLVKEIKIGDAKIAFTVMVSNPAMHSRKRMQEACSFAVERAFGKEVEVAIEVTGIPEEAQNSDTRKTLPGVNNIIAVASGKGGVGKSTVAVNLATGLAKRGYKVGFIDADIYGPSAPTMFDLVQDRPEIIELDGKQMIQPVMAHGVKVMSIGFFADLNQAIVWRGPMASKALRQMLNDVHWGDLDFMIIDLPPGTGDIHLTLVQAVPLTGAVVVSTPQEVALADARKGVAMFQLPSINVPVLGFIENMSWFTPEELPNNKYYIFGKEGLVQLAEQMEMPLLGQIPIVQSIREAGDIGRPAVLQEGTQVEEAFEAFITNFVAETEARNAKLPETKQVKLTR